MGEMSVLSELSLVRWRFRWNAAILTKTLYSRLELSDHYCYHSYPDMSTFSAARYQTTLRGEALLADLHATFLCRREDSVSSTSPSPRSVLVLYAAVVISHERADNGLMTFCSEFSESDVSSILLQSEPVLIRSKCSIFFFLSRNFCCTLRKLCFSWLISAILACLTFKLATKGQKGD